MQLRPDQLDQHLAQDLSPIYFITGDEPLQHAEAADAIRRTARERGYTSREVYEARADFAWESLAQAGANMSLFGDRLLIDLRLPTGKPGRDGGAALKSWAQAPPPDTLLLITAPKLEQQARQNAWYKALERAGTVITVTMPPRQRLAQWLTGRMRARGLQPHGDAVALLAEKVEGNLVAAAHEIDKLVLLHGAGVIDDAAVREAVADSSRYSAFDLADAMLDGAPERIGRIAAGLRGEGTAEALVFWAVHREVEQLAAIAARVEAGASLRKALHAAGVWQQRQERVAAAVRRHSAATWAQLLATCARLERLAKGAEHGSFWEELVELGLIVAGADLQPMHGPRGSAATPRGVA